MSEFKSLYNEFTGEFNTLTADNITVDSLNSEYVYVDVIEPFTLSGSVVVDGYDIAANFNEHEHALSSGLYNGGLLLIASDTTFSITDGAGVIVQNTSNPHTITPISWTNKTGIAATYINTALITFVSINSAGAVIQSITRPTNAETRTQIYLGVLVHTDLATITAVNQQQQFINAPALQLRDFLEALGPLINIDGNTITGNSNLTFIKSAGTVLAYGANYYISPLNPHRLDIGTVNTTTTDIEYRLVNGTNYYTGVIPGLVDPAYYESGGSRVAVSANKYTVQRVFLFTSGNIKLMYGQHQYNTLAAAKDAFRNDSFTVEASIKANGVLIAYIIIKAGTTSLTSTSDCFIINAGKFEGTSSSAGGTTLQLAYTNSETPEIITDTMRGGLTIKRGSSSDADVVLEVLDGSGIKSYSATGNNIYLNKLSTGVLHSNISGLITSSPVIASDISGGVAEIIINQYPPSNQYSLTFTDTISAGTLYSGNAIFDTSDNSLYSDIFKTDRITEYNALAGTNINTLKIKGSYLSAGVLHTNISGLCTTSKIVDSDISGQLPYSVLNLSGKIISSDVSGGISQLLTVSGAAGSYLIPLVNNIGTSSTYASQSFLYNTATENLSTPAIATNILMEYTPEAGINIVGAIFTGGYTTAGTLHCSASGYITSSLIVNADIDAAAGIVDTKLAQITTSGKIANTAMTSINKIGNNQGGIHTNSIAFGDQALGSSVSANLSVAIGPACQRDCLSGGSNTAVGYAALLTNQGGSFNVAIGRGSMGNTRTTTTGQTCVGYNAGNSLSGVGSNNTLIGRDAGSSMNSDLGENVAVGYLAGLNIIGGWNTCVGGSAGRYLSGVGNVVLGWGAGPQTANIGSSHNVLIGRAAGVNYLNSESNNIVIGYNVNGLSGESNKVRIGNSSITNNYFFGDVSATSFTGTNFYGTISGDLRGSLSGFGYLSGTHTGLTYGTISGDLRGSLSGVGYLSGTHTGLTYGTCSGTLNGIHSGTSTTQAVGNNSTSLATTEYVDRFWTTSIVIPVALFANTVIQGGNVNAMYYNYNNGNLSGSTSSLTFTAPTAGTYTFVGNMGKGANYGIATLYINGISGSTFDGYNAATTVGTWKATGLTLSGGSNTIELKSIAKNAASSQYYITGDSAVYLWRTS